MKEHPFCALWTDEELLDGDAKERCTSSRNDARQCRLTLSFADPRVKSQDWVAYVKIGTPIFAHYPGGEYPLRIRVLPEDRVPLRVAKTRARLQQG